MPEPILTIYNKRVPEAGRPPALSNESPDLYVGYFENAFGEQWVFTFNRKTREGGLRGGDTGWLEAYVVRGGRVAGLILGEEEIGWLRACWKAASS